MDYNFQDLKNFHKEHSDQFNLLESNVDSLDDLKEYHKSFFEEAVAAKPPKKPKVGDLANPTGAPAAAPTDVPAGAMTAGNAPGVGDVAPGMAGTNPATAGGVGSPAPGMDPTMAGGAGMDPTMGDGGMGPMDPTMAGAGGGMGVGGGMGGPNDQLTPSQLSLKDIGRIYTMKQLYYKLLAIDNVLKRHNDEELEKAKKTISKTLAMFSLVVDNLKVYKEDIDDIILKFYRFVERFVTDLDAYMKQKKSDKKENDEDKESLSDYDYDMDHAVLVNNKFEEKPGHFTHNLPSDTFNIGPYVKSSFNK